MSEGKPGPGPDEPSKFDSEKIERDYKKGDTYFVYDDVIGEYRKCRVGIINEKNGDAILWPEVGPNTFLVKGTDMVKMPKTDPGKPPAPDAPKPEKRLEGAGTKSKPEENTPDELKPEFPEDKPKKGLLKRIKGKLKRVKTAEESVEDIAKDSEEQLQGEPAEINNKNDFPLGEIFELKNDDDSKTKWQVSGYGDGNKIIMTNTEDESDSRIFYRFEINKLIDGTMSVNEIPKAEEEEDKPDEYYESEIADDAADKDEPHVFPGLNELSPPMTESEQRLRNDFPIGEFYKTQDKDGKEVEWQVAGYTEDGKVVLLNPLDPDEDQAITEIDLKDKNPGWEELRAVEEPSGDQTEESEDNSKGKDADIPGFGTPFDAPVFGASEHASDLDFTGFDDSERVKEGEDDSPVAEEPKTKPTEEAADSKDKEEPLVAEESQTATEKAKEKTEHKFKVGEIVGIVNTDGEEEDWVVDQLNPDGTYRIRKDKEDGVPGFLNGITEEELDIEKKDIEMNEAIALLNQLELQLTENIDKKPSVARKLINRYRNLDPRLKTALGLAALWFSINSGYQGIKDGAMGIRVLFSAANGAMAAEGASSWSQSKVLKPFGKWRNEDGSINEKAIQSRSKEEVMDAIAALTEEASAKGLKIDIAAAMKQREDYIEREKSESGKRAGKILEKLDRAKHRLSKMPGWQRAAIIGGVAAAGVTASVLFGFEGLVAGSCAQMVLGSITAQRRIAENAYDKSDLVTALRKDLIRRSDEPLTVKDVEDIQTKRVKNRRGRKKSAITGAVIAGVLSFFGISRASHANEGTEALVPGAEPGTVPDVPSGEVTVPEAEAPSHTPDVSVPGTEHGTTPSDTVTTTEPSLETSEPGQEAPEPTTPDYSHTGVPGEEAPTNDIDTSEPGGADLGSTPENTQLGSYDYKDEIEKAGGLSNFIKAISAPGGGEKIIDHTIKGLQGKGQLPPGITSEQIAELKTEWIFKLKLDGIIGQDNEIVELKSENFANTYDPNGEAHEILNHINSGQPSYESLFQANSGLMVDSEASSTTVPSGAETVTGENHWAEALAQDGKGHLFIEKMLESEASGMSDAQLDILADKIASRLEADGILNNGGGVIDYQRFNSIDPHQIIAEVSNDGVSNSLAEAANSLAGNDSAAPGGSTTNFFNQPEPTPINTAIPAEIPGITDALADPNQFAFEAAKPLSEVQLREIIDPKNGYLSKEVGETFQRLLGDGKNGLLKPHDFKIVENQLKLNLSGLPEASAPGHADYVGHQLLKDYNGVTEQQKGFFERIFGGLRKPESTASVTNPTILGGTTPEPQPSGNIATTPTPGDGNTVPNATPEIVPDVTPTPATPPDGTVVSGEENKPEVPNN